MESLVAINNQNALAKAARKRRVEASDFCTDLALRVGYQSYRMCRTRLRVSRNSRLCSSLIGF